MSVLAALALSLSWVWPLAGPPSVSRQFLAPSTAYGAGHRGVDLVGTSGEPVHAAGSGVVSVAGVLAGRGVVVIVHGRLRTTYEPVVASVEVGESVALGAVIGHLEAGHSGCPVVACLHWGLRRADAYLDPLALVGRGRVRLLPLGDRRPAAPLGAPDTGAPAEERVPTRATTSSRGTTAVLGESAAAVAAGVWLLRRRRAVRRWA